MGSQSCIVQTELCVLTGAPTGGVTLRIPEDRCGGPVEYISGGWKAVVAANTPTHLGLSQTNIRTAWLSQNHPRTDTLILAAVKTSKM